VDTIRESYPDTRCTDCEFKGCSFWHSGDLVPKGSTGTFCNCCWKRRKEYYEAFKRPLPIKQKVADAAVRLIQKRLVFLKKKIASLQSDEEKHNILLTLLNPCKTCFGHGWVKYLGTSDEELEKQCPDCKGSGIKTEQSVTPRRSWR